MDRRALARRRFRSLRLIGAGLDTPEAVVRWLGAVQSQDYAPGKWAIAQRLRRPDDAAIEAAIVAGRIVRTHVLRPTWHFVLREELRDLLALTAPRIRGFLRYYDRQLGIDARVRDRTARRLASALAGGDRTRAELSAALGAKGQLLGHLLVHAELDALICSGAPRGKQQTYALAEARLGPARPFDRDAALTDLVVRYFTSHGPATAKDLMWWSSLPRADVLRGVDLAGARLEREELGGLTFWHAGAGAARMRSPAVHLLQAYDEYSVGYSESKYLLAHEDVDPGFTAAREIYNHLVFLDGLLIGRWKRTIKPKEVAIETSLRVRIDRAAKAALGDAAEAHAAYLGLPLRLTF